MKFKILNFLRIIKYSILNSILKYLPFVSKKIFLLGNKFYYPLFAKNYNKAYFDSKINSYQKTFTAIDKELFNLKKINIYLDVGANFGYYTSFIKKFLINAEFNCFEPHPVSFYYLKKNLKNLENINFHNFALGKRNSKEFISMPSFVKGQRKSNLGLMRIGGKSNFLKYQIDIKKLDDLKLIVKPDMSIFIKIDVEGYEIDVLYGMKNFLSKNNKFILSLEINPQYQNTETLNKILMFFKDVDFKKTYYLKDTSDKYTFFNFETISNFNHLDELGVFDLYFVK